MKARVRHAIYTCFSCKNDVHKAIVITWGAQVVSVCEPCWDRTVRAVDRAVMKDKNTTLFTEQIS